jgi:hypothetical protein
MKFAGPTDVPGADVLMSLKSYAQAAPRAHHVIQYMPAIRHHKITYYQPEKEPRVGFVHESQVRSWERGE